MAGFETDLHVDNFLTDLSVAYSQDMPRVGDMVLPPVDADKISDLYVIYGTESFKRYADVRRGMTFAPEIRQTITRGHYRAEEHALKTGVPDAYRRDQDVPLDAEIDGTIFVTEAELNQREFNQLGLISDPTQVTQNLALSGTALWSDYTNSVPLTNIRAARSAVRIGVHRPANMMLVSADVDYVLADHPAIKDLVKYTDPRNLTEGNIPTTIRGLQIMVSNTNIDSTPYSPLYPPPAAVFAPAFSKSALVFYRAPNPKSRRTMTFGITLEVPDARTGGRGLQIRKWDDEGRKGRWIEASDTYALKLIAPLAGYLFAPAIA